MFSRLKKSIFFKNIALLASGTVFSQLIVILASPILTRLYTPEDFGFLAVFLAIVASFSQVVCGKYEIAIVVPKSDRDGMHLFGVALYFSAIVSVVLFLFLLFFDQGTFTYFKVEKLGRWLFIAPLALFLTGVLNAATFFSNRNKKYKTIMHTTMLRAICVLSVNIFLGCFGFDGTALILGNLIGLAVAVIFILSRQPKFYRKEVILFSHQKWNLFKKYSDYPIYNASTGLLNGLLLAMPFFFLNQYFSTQVVGYYALVIRVAQAPISVLSTAVSQVNLKKVVDLSNSGESIEKYLYKLSLLLLSVIALPAVVLFIFSSELFSFIFGTSWAVAGEYLQFLMPAIVLKFIASTLSTTLGATQNNRLGAIWKIVSFLTTACTFMYFAPQKDIYKLLIAVLVNDSFVYVLYFLFIIIAARRADKCACKLGEC